MVIRLVILFIMVNSFKEARRVIKLKKNRKFRETKYQMQLFPSIYFSILLFWYSPYASSERSWHKTDDGLLTEKTHLRRFKALSLQILFQRIQLCFFTVIMLFRLRCFKMGYLCQNKLNKYEYMILTIDNKNTVEYAHLKTCIVMFICSSS